MGYFSNGSEGDAYDREWCQHCIHKAGGCAVWDAHLSRNYEEANNAESILHLLIPRSASDRDNLRCRMFVPRPQPEAIQALRDQIALACELGCALDPPNHTAACEAARAQIGRQVC